MNVYNVICKRGHYLLQMDTSNYLGSIQNFPEGFSKIKSIYLEIKPFELWLVLQNERLIAETDHEEIVADKPEGVYSNGCRDV